MAEECLFLYNKLQRVFGCVFLTFLLFFSVGSVCSGTESDSIQVVQGFKNLLKGDGLLRNQDSIDWCCLEFGPPSNETLIAAVNYQSMRGML